MLSSIERNYAQMEKDALALVFGVKKFEKYLLGRKFKRLTDEQQLTTLFNPRRHTNSDAAGRVHCWLNFLANFQYVIEHRKGTELANADGLSCLPLPEGNDSVEDSFTFHLLKWVH